MHRTRCRAALAVTAALLAGVLAGCGGGAAPAGPTAAPRSPSPTATPTGTASSTATAAPSTPTPTPSVDASPARASGCLTRDLHGSLRGGDGALGSDYFTLVLTNTGAATCALGGYGGVSFVDDQGHQIGAAAQRDRSAGVRLVVLRPGESAGARLQVTVAANYDSATCRPQAASGLRVYPPNETAALFVRHRFDACAAPGVRLLTVRPYRALG